MANVVIGILYGIIIFTAVITLFFYSKIIDLKTEADICLFSLYEHLKIWDSLNRKLIDIICKQVECDEEKMIRLSEVRVEFLNKLSFEDNIYSIKEINKIFKELIIKGENSLVLKDNKDFNDISCKLIEVEKRILEIQQKYNNHSLLYNNFIIKFPNNIVAFILGVKMLFQVEITLEISNEELDTNF